MSRGDTDAERVRINVDDESDRWRWVCPNGHRDWEPTNSHFHCTACARSHDGGGPFEELLDLATDRVVRRSEIVLETSVGSYRDVYGEEGAP